MIDPAILELVALDPKHRKVPENSVSATAHTDKQGGLVVGFVIDPDVAKEGFVREAAE